jgi:hypothetical protein
MGRSVDAVLAPHAAPPARLRAVRGSQHLAPLPATIYAQGGCKPCRRRGFIPAREQHATAGGGVYERRGRATQTSNSGVAALTRSRAVAQRRVRLPQSPVDLEKPGKR